MNARWYILVTTLFLRFHVGFPMQFNMLIIIYDKEPDYLWNHPTPIVSAYFMRSDKVAGFGFPILNNVIQWIPGGMPSFSGH